VCWWRRLACLPCLARVWDVLEAPKKLQVASVAACTLLVALAVVFGALGALAKVREMGAERFARIVELRRKPEYAMRCARQADISAIYQFATDRLRTPVSQQQLMAAWMGRYAGIFFVAEPEGQSRIVGGFALLPLKTDAVREARADRLTGMGIRPADIAVDPKRAAGFYIGHIAGDTPWVKGMVLLKLECELERLDAGGKPVFATPVTEEGLRLCKKRQFAPVDNAVQNPMGRLHHATYTKP
jgi:hypothetical protein